MEIEKENVIDEGLYSRQLYVLLVRALAPPCP